MNIVDKTTGDIYTAAEFTQFKNEVQNAIISSSQGLISNSIQLKQALSRYSANGASYIASGTGDAIELSEIDANDPITAYYNMQSFLFVATATNTGAATINVNSLGAKAVKKDGWIDDVEAGNIEIGKLYSAVYSLADDAFMIVEHVSLPNNILGKRLLAEEDLAGFASVQIAYDSAWDIYSEIIIEVDDIRSAAQSRAGIAFLKQDLVTYLNIIGSGNSGRYVTSTSNNIRIDLYPASLGVKMANNKDRKTLRGHNTYGPDISGFSFANSGRTGPYVYALNTSWNVDTVGDRPSSLEVGTGELTVGVFEVIIQSGTFTNGTFKIYGV